jgi:hypothetical protein
MPGSHNVPLQWEAAITTTMKIITVIKKDKPALSGKFIYTEQLIFRAGWEMRHNGIMIFFLSAFS